MILSARLSHLSHIPTKQWKKLHIATRSLTQLQVPEAFIEPSEQGSGIKYLCLNRPQSKNAISKRLLKASIVNLLKHVYK